MGKVGAKETSGYSSLLLTFASSERLKVWLVVIITFILIGNALVVCYTFYPDFDGAMNFQVSSNLVEGKGYKPSYNVVKGNIQSGPTLILPTAMLFKFFGITKFTTQFTNFIFFLGLVSILILFCKRYFEVPVLTLLIVVASIPELYRYSLFGYGEAIAAFFTLVGLYLLPWSVDGKHGRSILVGCIFGLAAVTKMLSLISLLVLLVICFFYVKSLYQFRPLRSLITRWCVLLASLIAIPALFEFFKFLSLGKLEYTDNLAATFLGIQVRQGFGAITNDSVGLGASVTWLTAINSLQSEFNVSSIIIYGQFALVLSFAFAKFKAEKDKARRLLILCLITYFVMGLLWWHFFTGQQWWRRMFIFYLVFSPIIASVFQDIIRQSWSFLRNTGLRVDLESIGYAVACVVFIVPMSVNFYNVNKFSVDFQTTETEYKNCQIDSMLTVMKKLPSEATFLVDEWWQSPVLSLFSHRGDQFIDYHKYATALESFKSRKQVFFLLTYQQKKSAPGEYAKLFSELEPEITYKTADYALVDISLLKYHELMTNLLAPSEICKLIQEDANTDANPPAIRRWSELVDFSQGGFDEQLCEGWYSLEKGEGGGYRWIGKSATMFLPGNDSSRHKKLILSIFPVFTNLSEKQQLLDVSVDEVNVVHEILTKDMEVLNYNVPLTKELQRRRNLYRITVQVDNVAPPTQTDIRELGIIVSRIGIE